VTLGSGETRRVCADFDEAFKAALAEGWRVEAIWPADSPHSATLSRDGATLQLASRPEAPRPDGSVPACPLRFHVSPPTGDAGLGRAGMRYRDLIPDRMGGYAVASHIMIPAGGPVDDWPHFHRLALQFITVRHGWVRVVYEGQGPPFLMQAGDLVLQPPTIRHRVLESSPNLEVVEVSIPAEHETVADHQIDLPGPDRAPHTKFNGQTFLLHRGLQSPWVRFNGGEAQIVGLSPATDDRAEAYFIRPIGRAPIDVPAFVGELGFGFVLAGAATLDARGLRVLRPAAAFVIPPGENWRLLPESDDLRLLWVTTNGLSGQTA
jgi:quercetin dioxygenase-like cupin family protein